MALGVLGHVQRCIGHFAVCVGQLANQRLGVPVKARPPLLLQLLAIRLYKLKVTATSTVCDVRYKVILIRNISVGTTRNMFVPMY